MPVVGRIFNQFFRKLDFYIAKAHIFIAPRRHAILKKIMSKKVANCIVLVLFLLKNGLWLYMSQIKYRYVLQESKVN